MSKASSLDKLAELLVVSFEHKGKGFLTGIDGSIQLLQRKVERDHPEVLEEFGPYLARMRRSVQRFTLFLEALSSIMAKNRERIVAEGWAYRQIKSALEGAQEIQTEPESNLTNTGNFP